MWYYKDEPFCNEDKAEYQGFVYVITDNTNNKKYVGKKGFWSKVTKAPVKQENGDSSLSPTGKTIMGPRIRSSSNYLNTEKKALVVKYYTSVKQKVKCHTSKQRNSLIDVCC